MLISEINSREDLQNLTISRNATDDYDCSGYIVVTDGINAAITRFGHCSCYGTYTAIQGRDNSITFDWTGSVDELVKMARYKLDPHYSLGRRKAKQDDYDYGYLIACYQDVLKWNKNNRKSK